MSMTPATKAVTKQYDFLNATPDGDKLFSVRGGIPLANAFDQLSVYLSAVQSVVEEVAKSDDENTSANWAASQMIEFTQALVQSMHFGPMEHEKAIRTYP